MNRRLNNLLVLLAVAALISLTSGCIGTVSNCVYSYDSFGRATPFCVSIPF